MAIPTPGDLVPARLFGHRWVQSDLYLGDTGSHINFNVVVAGYTGIGVTAVGDAGFGFRVSNGEVQCKHFGEGWVKISVATAGSGDTGLMGVTGLQGSTGLSGLTGLTGFTGVVGETGSPGLGETGLQGVTGVGGGGGGVSRWSTLTPTGDYNPTPRATTYSGGVSGVYSDVPQWAGSTGKGIGDFVSATAPNGYIYECVTAGTTNSTEPTWGTILGASTTDNTVSWRCRGLSVVEMNSDKTASVKPGMGLRYAYNSTTYYGMVVDITATRMAIAGAPLLSTQVLSELSYSIPESVIWEYWTVNGYYGAGTDDKLLWDLMNTAYRWKGQKAYIVAFGVIHRTDAAGTQPKIQLKNNSNKVSNNDNDGSLFNALGVQVSSSWIENSWVDINTSNYAVLFNNPLEIECAAVSSPASGAGAASDLTVFAALVLE